MLCAWSVVNHCGGLMAIWGRSMRRHGLNAITSSSTAARMMDEVRLYARLIAAAPTPFSTRERIQLWTSMRVTVRISQSAQWGMTWFLMVEASPCRVRGSTMRASHHLSCHSRNVISPARGSRMPPRADCVSISVPQARACALRGNDSLYRSPARLRTVACQLPDFNLRRYRFYSLIDDEGAARLGVSGGLSAWQRRDG